MKVKVEVDCTPIEARQFFGLPDVGPMQAKLMAEMENKLTAQMETLGLDGLVRSWFSTVPQNAELFREMFAGMFQPRPKPNEDRT